MRTSVVVPSHRPGDWLAACLASVVDQADEVVVVDNGSPGESVSAVARAAGARVRRAERNLGFAGGVNLGVAAATGDVIALLNDDAAAGPGWLAAAAGALADPGLAAVTPKVRYCGWWREVRLGGETWFAPGDPRPLGRRLSHLLADGHDVLDRVRGPGVHRLESDASGRWRWSRPGLPVYVPVASPGADVTLDGQPLGGRPCRLLNKAGSLLAADGTLGDRGEGEPDDGRYDDPAEQFFASGTAMAFTATTWRRVGGLAEPLFAYYEDADWSWRARLAGLAVRYDPAAVVDHRQSATSGGAASPLVRRLAPGNHALCLVRNAPPAPAAALLTRELRRPEDDGARRSLVARLPWGLASRVALSRRWQRSPREVWDRWAGAPPAALTPAAPGVAVSRAGGPPAGPRRPPPR